MDAFPLSTDMFSLVALARARTPGLYDRHRMLEAHARTRLTQVKPAVALQRSCRRRIRQAFTTPAPE
jgi:hypothetical protein